MPNQQTIKLLIKNAGKTLIQVIDNGKGMSVTDARLSFERHATSKIKAAEDLFALHTKGFRGEALWQALLQLHMLNSKLNKKIQNLGTAITIEGQYSNRPRDYCCYFKRNIYCC